MTPAEKLRSKLTDVKFIDDIEEARNKKFDLDRVLELARELRKTFKDDEYHMQPRAV